MEEGHCNRIFQGCCICPLAQPALMCSGPAIPLDKLMPPCSLWCSAPEVVCIPQPGAVSHSYYTPPDLCVLGSVMSLLPWSGFAVPVANCVFKQGCGVPVYVYVCVSSTRKPSVFDLLPVSTTDGRHVSELVWHSEQMRRAAPSSSTLLVDHFMPFHCTSECNYGGSD